MDYKIKIGSALSPKDKIVSKTDTPAGLLKDMGISYQDGSVSLNGGILGSREMSSTLEELNVEDGDHILVNSKQNSGNEKGC